MAGVTCYEKKVVIVHIVVATIIIISIVIMISIIIITIVNMTIIIITIIVVIIIITWNTMEERSLSSLSSGSCRRIDLPSSLN